MTQRFGCSQLSFLPASSVPGWTLHVDSRFSLTGVLVYDFGDGVLCKVELTSAMTRLVLALAACREIDVRDGRVVNLGHCGMDELGDISGAMPGADKAVDRRTVGGYKRAIIRRIKKALKLLSDKSGRQLEMPPPILNPAYGRGYCLAEDGLALSGIDLDALVLAARAVMVR